MHPTIPNPPFNPFAKSRASGIKRAFTLIELLVVIAIISLLAAILFPVFGRARENARRSSCQSNLKQLGLAVQQYTIDYDDAFPTSYFEDVASGIPPGGSWYSGNPNRWYWPQIVYPYHKSMQVFLCPSQANYKDIPYVGHYGANNEIIKAPGSTVKMAAVVSSAGTYLAMDYGAYSSGPANARTPGSGYFYLPGYGEATKTSCPATLNSDLVQDCQTGRHLGGVNVVFVDGHVKFMRSEILYRNALTSPYGQWRPSNNN